MMTKHYFFPRYKYISLKYIFFDKNKKDNSLNVMQAINEFKTPFCQKKIYFETYQFLKS